MKKSLLTCSFFLSLFLCRAEIIYTEVSPVFKDTLDPMIPFGDNTDIFAIDFNQDGSFEYNLRWDDWGDFAWFIHLTKPFSETALRDYSLKGDSSNMNNFRYLQVHDQNDAIDNSLTWDASAFDPLIGDNGDPNFEGQGKKYIGVRFELADGVHFGWIEIEVTGKVLSVSGYAYESNTDTPIQAGDRGKLTPVSKKSKWTTIQIHPNPCTNYLTIQGYKHADLQITNILGEVVKQQIVNSHNESIMVSELERGAYYIKVQSQDGTKYTNRFVKL